MCEGLPLAVAAADTYLCVRSDGSGTASLNYIVGVFLELNKLFLLIVYKYFYSLFYYSRIHSIYIKIQLGKVRPTIVDRKSIIFWNCIDLPTRPLY